MRKIILSLNITEDGFIAGNNGELNWHFPYWSIEMSDALCKILASADTLLLGRKTYLALAGYWTIQGIDLTIAREDIVLAEMLNRFRKIVVSNTLSKAAWANSTLVEGDVIGKIGELKQGLGKDIVIFGSISLVSSLMTLNLIDEVHLWVHPVAIIHGNRLFKDSSFSKLEPYYVERFDTGVVKQSFRATEWPAIRV